MENCLVTKLKESVNNPNLPYFKELHLTWTPYQSSSNSDTYTLYINTGNSDVDITVAIGADIYKTGASAYHINAGDSAVLTANSQYRVVLNKADWPSVEVQDFIIIKNYYQITLFFGKTSSRDVLYPIMVSLDTPSSGVKFIYENAPLVVAGIGGGKNLEDVKFASSIQKLLITTHLNSDILTLNRVFVMPDLQHLHIQSDVSGWSERGAYALNSTSRNNTSLRLIFGKGYGNLLDVPANLEWLDVRTGSITGKIEDLVARFRANGRTSGIFGLLNSDYCGTIKFTYNGEEKSLESLDFSVGGPIKRINGVAWLTWDASTIQFVDTLPSGAEKYNNAQYPNASWTPYYSE